MATFAERQLEKYGWEKGKGLGRHKQGRKDIVKVSVKNDNKGIGVDADTYKFQWWDHVYNKSMSQIVVHTDDASGEVKMSSTAADNTGLVSRFAPDGSVPEKEQTTTAGVVEASPLYSMFVKSATFDPKTLLTTPAPANKGKTSGDMSVLSKMTDAEVFALCEGRTARKGARVDADVMGTGKIARADDKLGQLLAAVGVEAAGDKAVGDKETEGATKDSGKGKKRKKDRSEMSKEERRARREAKRARRRQKEERAIVP
ncbi:hypothetical protein RI367_001620 [Sorochytrium milnesiophthora]